MRFTRMLIGSVAVVGVLVAVAWAAQGQGGGHVDTQSFKRIGGPISKTTSNWTTIPGLVRTTSCPDNDAATAQVSLEFAPGSQAIDLRVVLDDISIECPDCPGPADGRMNPKAVTFSVTGAEDSRSFTFVDENVPGIHGTRFIVQWRLHRQGGPNAFATLRAATLNVLWDKTEEQCA